MFGICGNVVLGDDWNLMVFGIHDMHGRHWPGLNANYTVFQIFTLFEQESQILYIE